MITKKIVALLSNYMLLTFFFFPLCIYGQNLTLELRINKTKFLKSESVWSSVVLQNHSSRTITTDQLSLDFGYMRFEILDAAGTKYEDKKRDFNAWKLSRQSMQPMERDSVFFNLLPLFGTGDWRPFQTKKFFPVGKYSVEAVYLSDKRGIHSNKVEFEVVESEGINKEAHDLLDRATDLEIEGNKGAAISALDDLETRLAGNVFTPIAMYQKIHLYSRPGEKDNAKATEAAFKLIEKFANTENALLGKTYLLTHSSPDKRREVLETLSNKYPNTLVGREATKTLSSEKNAK
jgi:hypothetical protein